MNASAVLEGFLDALDIEATTFVVHDIGGPVTFGVTARRPELVSGVVVMGSFAWSLNEEFPAVARFIRLVNGRTFGTLNTNFNLLARLTSTKYGVGRCLSRSGKRAFRGPFHSRHCRRNAVALLGNALESDEYLTPLEDTLASILDDSRVLFVFGENDAGRTAGFQDRWETLFPDASSETVDGANHFPMADAPHFVASVLCEWHAEAVNSTQT